MTLNIQLESFAMPLTKSLLIVATLLCMSACGQKTNTKPATSVHAVAESPVRDENSAEAVQILEATREAYKKLRTYRATVNIETRTDWGDGSPLKQNRDYRIWYQQPSSLRVEGVDFNGMTHALVANGESVVVYGVGSPRGEKYQTIEAAMIALSGVSLRATMLLPGILLDIQWGTNRSLWESEGDYLSAMTREPKLKLLGTEKVLDVECYRIESRKDIVTRTLWIDSETSQIVRISEEADSHQMQAQRQQGGGGRTGLIDEIDDVHTVISSDINGKIDDAVFDARLPLYKGNR